MKFMQLELFTCFFLFVRWVNCQNEVAGCLGDVEFVVVDEEVNFTQAKNRCVNKEGLLAGITSQQEHNVVVDLIDQLISNNNNIWIGTFGFVSHSITLNANFKD